MRSSAVAEELFGAEDDTEPESEDESRALERLAQERRQPIADPEVWMDYWSEELLTLWHLVQDQCASNGYAILDRCSITDFADFCFRKSSGTPPAA